MAERGAQASTTLPPTKLEFKNAHTVALVVVEDNEKAMVRLLVAELSQQGGLKMHQMSQEVAGEDLKQALECTASKTGRGR